MMDIVVLAPIGTETSTIYFWNQEFNCLARSQGQRI
jgi:hypothetical protein